MIMVIDFLIYQKNNSNICQPYPLLLYIHVYSCVVVRQLNAEDAVTLTTKYTILISVSGT